MNQQQQKQRENLLRQVQNREIKPQVLQGGKLVFGSQTSHQTNPYLKSQLATPNQNMKPMVPRPTRKTPAELANEKAPTSISSPKNNSQSLTGQVQTSPPKIFQVQQIYGSLPQQQSVQVMQQQQQKVREIQQQKKQQITEGKRSVEREKDFKIRHSGSSGSVTTRDSKKAKLPSDRQNYFSPLDIQDQTKVQSQIGFQTTQQMFGGSQSARIQAISIEQTL